MPVTWLSGAVSRVARQGGAADKGLTAASDALDRFVAAMTSLGIEGFRDLEVAENVGASERVVALDGGTPVDGHALDRLAETDGFTGVSTPHGVRGDAWVTDTLVAEGHPPVPLRGARVVAVEGDRVAAADLAANARASNGAVVAIHQSVEAFVGSGGRSWRGSGGGSQTLVIDPPRTGMSREALAGITEMREPRIVYVSCDVATLARDARRLVDAGYSISRVEAFDLFQHPAR